MQELAINIIEYISFLQTQKKNFIKQGVSKKIFGSRFDL